MSVAYLVQLVPSWYCPHWQIGERTALVEHIYPTGQGIAAMLPAGA